MEIITETFQFKTKGHTDIIDITPRVQQFVSARGMKEGSVLLFVAGSTGAITTVEYEPGLVNTDLPRLFDSLAPYGDNYAHHDTWHDDNGAAHVRASLVGSSLEVPFQDGQLVLGTWQQIIVLDFDTRARSRKLVAQIKGIRK